MTSPEPGIARRALDPLIAGLGALGHDASSLFRAAGIEPGLLEDPETRIPHGAAMSFWHQATESTGDSALGLRLARAAPLESFGLHAYAVLASASLGDALERTCRYQRLIHDATRLTLEREGDLAWLRHALPGGRSVPRQPAEFLLATYVRFAELVTEGNWAPRRLQFAHAAPDDLSPHREVFGDVPLRFDSAVNALVLCGADLGRPNPKANPGLLAVLDRHASDLSRSLPETHTWSDRVRQRFATDACGRTPTAGEMAAALRLSSRTLARRLSTEGASFTRLLEQFRRERAARLLGARRESIAEVAFALGFSDLSAFYRWFKRWARVTPAEYRARGESSQSF